LLIFRNPDLFRKSLNIFAMSLDAIIPIGLPARLEENHIDMIKSCS